jgi:hypothetical protein
MRRGQTAATLTILAPGLLGPVPLLPEHAPATPALDRVLARGRAIRDDAVDASTQGLTAGLLQRFQVTASAPYARAADDPAWDRRGYVLHADPVHLRADRDRLRLFGARHLGISRAEADALAAEVNAFVEPDGLRLMAPLAGRWYLESKQQLSLASRPLEQVAGREVDQTAFNGEGAARWNALLTEVQMLLFQSPVNRDREGRGQPMVNALWVWGGGEWQNLNAPAGLRRICADDPLAGGLAAASGLELCARDAFTAGADTLLVEARLAEAVQDTDETSWRATVEALEYDVSIALDRLREGEIDVLTLDLCDGRRWELDRGRSRRFWLRGTALAERVQGRARA